MATRLKMAPQPWREELDAALAELDGLKSARTGNEERIRLLNRIADDTLEIAEA
ncbi:hypothetical protein [Aquamicrobium terrae]|uniref:Histidine kinase n=1 Tax=Aquamicrobium terrae TaxID=1324945 RepID=A0ABV2N7H9_9HYPH